MIPLVDLVRRHKAITPILRRIFLSHVASGDYILGDSVGHFEHALSEFIKVPYAIGVSNGTDALNIALTALDIGPGDEVIVPAMTFVSTAFAVMMRGAKPVLVDVEPITLTMDPNSFNRAITKKTKAVIPVHLYGMPADMNAIGRIARENKLSVIEDAAQALGSTYETHAAGSMGTIGCFSFYPAKNLGALGDAGAVVTNNMRLYSRIARLRNLGGIRKYVHAEVGGNSRLDSLQASVLLAELPLLKKWNAKRVDIAAQYHSLLHDLPISLPREISDRTTNYHLFVIRVQKRKSLQDYLLKRGVQTGIHYPRPLHTQPALRSLGYDRGTFPVSERAAREVLSIPMFPELTAREIHKISQSIREFYS